MLHCIVLHLPPYDNVLLTTCVASYEGMQGLPINLGETRGILLNETLLPQHLKRLGYVTRLVGKWHVGHYTEKHTPTRRGFDSFLGYYGGYIKYFNHVVTKNVSTYSQRILNFEQSCKYGRGSFINLQINKDTLCLRKYPKLVSHFLKNVVKHIFNNCFPLSPEDS